jgi:hypothetical protein
MEQQRNNLELQRSQMHKFDRGDLAKLTDEYIDSFKRQIICMKE